MHPGSYDVKTAERSAIWASGVPSKSVQESSLHLPGGSYVAPFWLVMTCLLLGIPNILHVYMDDYIHMYIHMYICLCLCLHIYL